MGIRGESQDSRAQRASAPGALRPEHRPSGSLVAATAFVDRVGEHECRNADDERAGQNLKNAHEHLLAALQCGGLSWPFKAAAWNVSWNNDCR